MSVDFNPFEAHAETIRPNRWSAEAQAERRAQQKGEREAAPLARKQKEKAILTRRWKQARREEWKATLETDYGIRFAELRRGLKRFEASEAEAFVEFVHSQAWLQTLPKKLQLIAIGLLQEATIRIRAKAGYEFIDDALPGEPPTALQRCCAFVRGEQPC